MNKSTINYQLLQQKNTHWCRNRSIIVISSIAIAILSWKNERKLYLKSEP